MLGGVRIANRVASYRTFDHGKALTRYPAPGEERDVVRNGRSHKLEIGPVNSSSLQAANVSVDQTIDEARGQRTGNDPAATNRMRPCTSNVPKYLRADDFKSPTADAATSTRSTIPRNSSADYPQLGASIRNSPAQLRSWCQPVQERDI
jgi:hypothetical protein